MNILSATLDHIDGEQAVLLFEDGQKLRVNKTMVPGFVKGDIVNLVLATDEDAGKQRDKLLKGILNDIIDDEAEDSEKTK